MGARLGKVVRIIKHLHLGYKVHKGMLVNDKKIDKQSFTYLNCTGSRLGDGLSAI